MSKGTRVLLVIILILVLLLLGFGAYFAIKYLDKNKETTDVVNEEYQDNEKVSEYYEPTEEEKERTKELENILKANLPIMDGSTSTIPLEGGIKSALFGITQEKAEAGIVHSTTYGSFDNLIEGKCDIIFSTPLSEKQYEKAKEANIDLVETPVVYEGFVFVVNASNPVDTLTQQQLKDIYSGKITNWKQVGGNDAEIVAYQRNETSGSQNYMKTFMKDSNLMEPVTSFTPASMSGLMDAIATYDNSENAIGYSVYAYAANMYGNGNEIKFIKVDGVDPTKETMASQEYPLLNYNYAIYNKKSEDNTTVDELTEWLLTYNGQVSMINAGYVPIKNIKVKELIIEPYSSKGTSEEVKSEKADYYYVVEPYEITDMTDIEWWNREDEGAKITKLKNQVLQDEINKFIEDSVEKLKLKEKECKKYVELLNKNSDEYFDCYQYDGIRTELNCINGYLSVKISLGYQYAVQGGFEYTYANYSKIYDLYYGKELSLSDLFYKNENFVDIINQQIEWRIPYEVELSIKSIEMKHPYAVLPKEGYSISFDRDGDLIITFDKENPYFIEGVEFEINTYLDDLSCINRPRDMEGIFNENLELKKNIYENYFNTKLEQKITSKYKYSIFYLDCHNEELDSFINNYIDKELINDGNITKGIEKIAKENPDYVFDFGEVIDYKREIDIKTELKGNKYVVINIEFGMITMDTIYFNVENKKEVSEEEVNAWQESFVEEY